MKIEEGVMVMKNGLGWGKTYDDGHSSSYGWMAPEEAPIHNPNYCTSPTDVTYKGSPYTKELSTAKLVRVRRVTMIEATPEP